MAGVADSVLSGLVERLIQLASDEIGLIAGVEGEMGKLKTTLNMINDVLADAEQRQSEYRSVRTWLQELYEVVCDAEDLFDEFATDAAAAALLSGGKNKKRSLVCRKVRKLISKHRTAHGIREIRRRLDDICGNREKLGIQLVPGLVSNVHNTAPAPEPTTGFTPFQEYLVPRTREKEIIMGWLFSSADLQAAGNHGGGGGDHSSSDVNVPIFAVFGMGGMGKTTLAQSVYSDDRVKGFFQLRMWVCVSTTEFNVLRITSEMVSSLLSDATGGAGVLGDGRNLDALQRRVQEGVSGKRFLLVLDDVWGLSTNWGDLFKPLRDGKGGSRVLVTTRIENVAATMSAGGPVLRLGGLPEEDALSVLRNSAGADDPRHAWGERREKLCEGISKKLGGSPLAAKVIGRLLNSRFDHLDFWESLLTSTSELAGRRDQSPGINEEDGGGLLPVLKLSYDRLSPNLKECFAYCSLFPKDHVFHGEMLVQLWMAQGFVRSRPTDHPGLPVEYWGERLLEDLVSFSLLERRIQGPDGTCVYVMHDLIHDLAVSVSRDYYYVVRQEPATSCKIPEKVRHVSWIVGGAAGSDLLEPRPDDALLSKHEKLRTLLFLNASSPVYCFWYCDFDFDAFLDKGVCDKLRCLRVLGLRGSPVKSLPPSIGALKHLRRLDLSMTFIQHLPASLGSLHNLLALKLEDCPALEELPQSVGTLASLRDLFLRRTSIKQLPQSICNLESLRRLLLDKTLIVELPESLGSLRNLEVLHLGKCRRLKGLPHSVSQLGNLRKLDLGGCRLVQELPPSVGDLANLKFLILSSTAVKRLPESLGSLSVLEVLDLGGCASLEQVPPQSVGRLGNLRELILEELPCLQDLPPSVCNLSNLEFLNLRSTPIRRLPESLGRLCNLQALILAWCQSLEELPRSVGGLTNLQSLNLCGTKIRELPETLGNLCKLQYLNLGSCQCLEGLPESLGKLSNLQMLHLDSCRSIERLPESLGLLCNLQELHLGFCQSLESLPHSLCKLHKLRVLDLQHCPLTTAPDSISELVNLQQLFADDRLLCTISHPEGMTTLQQLATAAHPRELKHLNELRSLQLYDLDQVKSGEEAGEAQLHGKSLLTSLQLHFSKRAGEDELPEDVSANCPVASVSDDVADDTAQRHEEVLEGLRPHLPSIRQLKIRGYRGVRSPGWMLDPRIHQGFPSMEKMVLENAPLWEGELWGYSLSHIAAADNYHDDQEKTQLTHFPRLRKLCFRDCPKLKWPTPAAFFSPSSSSLLSANPAISDEKQAHHLLFSSSVKSLRVKLLFTGGDDDDRRISHLLSCLQELIWLQGLCIKATIRSTSQADDQDSSNNDMTTTTAATLLSPPGAEVLQPFMASLRKLSISNCPALSPFARCSAVIERRPGPPIDLPPLPSQQQEQQRQQQRRHLDLLVFRRTPPQLISRILRALSSLLWPRDLVIDSCYELRSLGDGIDDDFQDSNGATTGRIIGRQLEEALLALAPTLSGLSILDCPNLQCLPSKLSSLSSLENLLIDGSHQIQSLPEAGVPSSLRELHITGCSHKLVERCQEGGIDWPKISHIRVLTIDTKPGPSLEESEPRPRFS